MHRRQPPPRLWLMTDERQGEGLWGALERLPRGSGIVFRHYGLEAGKRRKLFERVKRAARRRGLMLLLAAPPDRGRAWGADGSHRPSAAGRRQSRGLRTASAHDLREIGEAARAGVDLLFLSPVFATRSHPGAKPLGAVRLGLLARRSPIPVVALGGMNARRARALARLPLHGWAAIDAWND